MKTKSKMKTAFAALAAMLMLAGAITIVPENDAIMSGMEFDSDTSKVDEYDVPADKYSVNGNELTLYDGLETSYVNISGSDAVLNIDGTVTIGYGGKASLLSLCDNLTITGSGTLVLEDGLWCRYGDLTITGGVTMISDSLIDVAGTLTISDTTVYAYTVFFKTLNTDRMIITGVGADDARTELTENDIAVYNDYRNTFYLNGETAYNIIMTSAGMDYDDDNWYYNQYLDRNGTIYDTSSSSDDDTTVIAAVAAAVAALAVICIAAIAIRRN